ncbi:substrate-binding domain-containing protein [Aestuariirhabdus sp. Z084]|uniref:substrate-binding domain-containing protein n=1 Tax=Aestuariirhabdus haliotis TaxID=2918751 RepID=UPI00201B374D|nr:substrate-binding domain-containing protein [Aestuariirhabdus haliotis]MCL6415751.1 substrate-binding domain-containing protein [Aestuariirhabdus haliotis]MCL6419668.1 substrate-binding domain-containing protein [Aestuariirhabdus haliotis]
MRINIIGNHLQRVLGLGPNQQSVRRWSVYFLALLLGSPLATAAEEKMLFSMAGSNTVGAVLGPELAKAYLRSLGARDISQIAGTVANESVIRGWHQESDSWLTIGVEAHGSSSGFKALKSNNAQLAAASRRVKTKEVRALEESFGNLRGASSEHTVALDGLAIVVHPENPIGSLNLEQVAQIFAGNITNWTELEGPDLPISLYARDDLSGTWDTFKSLVLAKRYKLSEKARRFESNQELSNLVSQDPGAIGFVSLNTIAPSKPLAIAASATSPAMLPEPIRVATEDYPLARRLYLYLPEKATNPQARSFVDFALGDAGQQIVASTGYMSQEIRALDAPIVTEAPSRYLEQIKGARRLSVNFRFSEGKAQLDNKAARDLQRLGAFSQNLDRDQRLLLLGFAEENGNTRNAQLLSDLRTGVVKRALVKAGVSRKQLDAAGIGAFMGLSDQQNLVSKVRNRRVEVWLVN